jgi:hypothetical protein
MFNLKIILILVYFLGVYFFPMPSKCKECNLITPLAILFSRCDTKPECMNFLRYKWIAYILGIWFIFLYLIINFFFSFRRSGVGGFSSNIAYSFFILLLLFLIFYSFSDYYFKKKIINMER